MRELNDEDSEDESENESEEEDAEQSKSGVLSQSLSTLSSQNRSYSQVHFYHISNLKKKGGGIF